MTKHAIARVRHEPRRRLLTVQNVQRLTPNMVRVTLGGDLAGFVSSAYDDHVKVFFPLAGPERADDTGAGSERAGACRGRRTLAGPRLHAAPL